MASKLSVPEKCRIKDVKIFTRNVLGTGSYGVVYVAVYHGTKVAAKKLHGIFFEGVSPAEIKGILKSWQQELELMSSLRHPNIVQFYGVYNSRNSSSLELSGDSYIISELMAKSLQARNLEPPRLNFRNIVDIALDIASGLCYLHNRDHPIMHRDLASKNILLSVSGQAKIADLGVAKITLNVQTTHTRHPGTDLYMPVEAVVGKNDYNHSIDIYGLGVVILELSIGRDPIATQCLRKVGKSLEIVPERERRQKDFDEFKQSCNSEELESVIMSCLKDKEDRAMASDVVEQLENLQNNDSYKLGNKASIFNANGNLSMSAGVDEARLSVDLEASKAKVSNLVKENENLFAQYELLQKKFEDLTTENERLEKKLKNQEKEKEDQKYRKTMSQLQNGQYLSHVLQQPHYANNSPKSLPAPAYASEIVMAGSHSMQPSRMFQSGLSTDSGRSPTIGTPLYHDTSYGSQDTITHDTPDDEDEYSQDYFADSFPSMPTFSGRAPPLKPHLSSLPSHPSQTNRPFYSHHQMSNSQYHKAPTIQVLTPSKVTGSGAAVFGSSVPPFNAQLTVQEADEYLSYQVSCMDRVIVQLMNSRNSDNLQSNFLQTLREQMINTGNYIRKMPFHVGNVAGPINRIKRNLDSLLNAKIHISHSDKQALNQAIYQLQATIRN